MALDFSKVQTTSTANGFINFVTQPFSQTIPGQTLAFFSGTLHSYSATISIPLTGKTTNQVLESVLINTTNTLSAGQYYNLSTEYSNNFIIGSSGGFPIFYVMNINVTNDTNNCYVVVFISNPSAVNNVTVPTITVSGKAFLYESPFN